MDLTQAQANQKTEDFLTMLAYKKFYQFYAAEAYCDLLVYHHSLLDWRRINEALIDKWSMAGLKRVKEMAWKMLYEGVR